MNHVGFDFFTCLADKAGAPGKIETTAITATTIKFRWTAPKKDTGRSKVFAYYLKALPLNGTRRIAKTGTLATATVSFLEYTFSGLRHSTYYRISVAAVNNAGQGLTKQATYKTALMKKGKIT